MTDNDQARRLIAELKLQQHPEGGYFAEIYRSEGLIPALALTQTHHGFRHFLTSIYFLLLPGQISKFHRLKSDEIWYYHAGSSLCIHCLTPAGDYQQLRLGPDITSGQSFQQIVPAGTWFAATIDEPQQFSLVGCAVAPGFDFADFELADGEALSLVFPKHREIIARLS